MTPAAPNPVIPGLDPGTSGRRNTPAATRSPPLTATWPPTRTTIPARLAAWAEAERGRFFPFLAVAMLAGVTTFFTLRTDPPPYLPPTLLAAAVALCLATWRLPPARAAALLLAAATLGFAAAHAATRRAPPIDPLPTRATILTATIRAVDLLPEGRRILLEQVRLAPDLPPLHRHLRIRLKRGDTTPLAAGDQVQIRALLRPPAPPAYPGAWDLQRDAYFNRLAGGGTALNPITVLQHAPPSTWPARLNALRDAVTARTIAATPGPAGAIAATLLTGGTAAIPQPDRAAFRDSGLAHLLAVAGLHIGIVMGLFMLTTRLALAAWPHAALHWPTKPIAGLTALAAGAAYLLLTGAHVPILRSFAMACLVTLALVVGRRALSFRGLALAAAAIALVAPQEVVGVSFQMSFAAVLALIAGYEALRPHLARLHGPGWRRIPAHVAALLLTSLLAGTASAPYGAYHFGHIQLYFIAANLIAVPLTAVWVVPWAVLGLLLMPLGLERLAFTAMAPGLDAILYVARTVAAWPAATIAVPPMPPWGLATFSLGLAWLCLWRTRPRRLGLPLIALGLLSPLLSPRPDILVSPDARLIALRDGPTYVIQSRPGAAPFIRDSWTDHLAAGPLRPITDTTPGCTPTTCRQGPALLLRNATQTADCTAITLLISAEPARGICPAATLLDRFTVWRDGAHAVWLNGNAHAVWLNNGAPTILSDRAARGTRPWVPGPPVPRRVVPNLPMAPTEPLPEGED